MFTMSLEYCEYLGLESSSGSSNPSGPRSLLGPSDPWGPSNPLGPRSSELFGFKEFKEASIDSKNSFASEESPGPKECFESEDLFHGES